METKVSSNNRLFEFQERMLEKEIDYIHSQIAHFDDLSFKIKGWAVTIWSGIVVFGAKEDSSLIICIGIPSILAFWILDAYFKRYQKRTTARMGAIETFFDSEDDFAKAGLKEAFENRDFGSFPIHDPVSRRTKDRYDRIKESYKRNTSYLRCFFVTPNIRYFYGALLLAAIIMASIARIF